MKHSIIITYHKNKDMLFFCLKRLLRTTDDNVEILIIGNNATAAELDFDISFPRCYYYKFETNLQYPKAINYGVSKCKGDIITFVDADIFVWNGWYEELLDCLLSSPISVQSVQNLLIHRIKEFWILALCIQDLTQPIQ